MRKAIILSAGCAGTLVAIAVVLLFPSHEHALTVDPIISKGDFGTYTHVFIKNIGRLPATNVRVDYGNQKSDFIPIIEPGDRVMLSPPDGSNLTQVIVTADGGIAIVKEYAEPTNAHMIGTGGFGQ